MVIHDYIASDKPNAARDFVQAIEDRCRELVHAPMSGRSFARSKRIRSIPFQSYLVLYEVTPDTIRIADIVHGKRKKAGAFVPPSPPHE